MFKATVKIIEFNDKEYITALNKKVEEQMKEAAREWLRAVIVRVPVYTGMARESLLPLSRYLNVAIPIDPIAKRRGPSGEIQQYFAFEQQGEQFTFKYSTEVPHYLINEFNVGLGSPPLTHPTPWHSFEAGRIAWREYVTTVFKYKLPNIKTYFRTQVVQ